MNSVSWAATTFTIMTAVMAIFMSSLAGNANGDLGRGAVASLFAAAVVAMAFCLWGIVYDSHRSK